jgi:hypothetical protein
MQDLIKITLGGRYNGLRPNSGGSRGESRPLVAVHWVRRNSIESRHHDRTDQLAGRGHITGIQQLYVIDEIWRDLRRKNPHATGDSRILYSL